MVFMENLNKTESEHEALKSIILIGYHLPKKCGLAAFTAHLLEAITLSVPNVDCWAVAMNDQSEGSDYPSQVRLEINQDQLKEYNLTADRPNFGHVGVVCVQHEYGIFGGPRGRFVIELLSDLKMPIVTTLHTYPGIPLHVIMAPGKTWSAVKH